MADKHGQASGGTKAALAQLGEDLAGTKFAGSVLAPTQAEEVLPAVVGVRLALIVAREDGSEAAVDLGPMQMVEFEAISKARATAGQARIGRKLVAGEAAVNVPGLGICDTKRGWVTTEIMLREEVAKPAYSRGKVIPFGARK